MNQRLKKEYCLNCGTHFPEAVSDGEDIYCSSCGQSSKESRLSFSRLLKDAISNVFNLDGRLIHTFRDIFHPSKLTQAYIAGRRKYYVNPVRLFIFMLIGLITLSLSSVSLENSAMGVDQIYSKAERSKLFDEYNTLVDSMQISGHEYFTDTIRELLFFNVRSLKTDTLGKNGPQLFNWGNSASSFGISTYDGIHLTQKELFEKYKVDSFWDKINVGQYIRFRTDPAGGIKYIIKNLSWAVFITVLLIGFLMKIIYIRSSYYLVEHVVLTLNSHSLLFLLIALNIILLVFVPLGGNKELISGLTIGPTFFLVFIVQFLTLKKYFKQGVFKTLLKQLMINSAYFLIFSMVVLTVGIISLILY